MKINFLKLLWLLFVVPVVGGITIDQDNHKRSCSFSEIRDQESNSEKANTNKKYGAVIDLGKCSNFVEIIKQSFGIDKDMNTDEAISLTKEENDVLETKKVDTNLLFCNGDAFINGLMNVTHGFDDFVVGGKQYKARQLCEEFGVSVGEIDAMKSSVGIFSKLKRILNSNRTDDRIKPLISSFWNETKDLKDDAEISDALQNYQEKSDLNNWHRKMLFLESEYIKSLNILKVDMSTISSGRKGFFESFKIMKEIILRKTNHLLEQFGEYIGFFNLSDGNDKEEFLEKFEELKSESPIDYIQCAEDLCSEYTRYTHTEFIVEYLYRNQLEPLNMVTVRDPCKSCEEMAAKITPEQPNRYSFIISGKRYRKYDQNCNFCNRKKRRTDKYHEHEFVIDPECRHCEDSRDKDRSNDQTNHSLRLVQLNLESSQRN